MKEATDFYNRIRLDKETQDKKFEAENQVRQNSYNYYRELPLYVLLPAGLIAGAAETL